MHSLGEEDEVFLDAMIVHSLSQFVSFWDSKTIIISIFFKGDLILQKKNSVGGEPHNFWANAKINWPSPTWQKIINFL